jgi:hypothetical protein
MRSWKKRSSNSFEFSGQKLEKSAKNLAGFFERGSLSSSFLISKNLK